MREHCWECVMKHIAQACILEGEARLGYPVHMWLAMGHLAEAEAECPCEETALLIRNERKQYEVTGGVHRVNTMNLLERCLERMASSGNDISGTDVLITKESNL